MPSTVNLFLTLLMKMDLYSFLFCVLSFFLRVELCIPGLVLNEKSCHFPILFKDDLAVGPDLMDPVLSFHIPVISELVF